MKKEKPLTVKVNFFMRISEERPNCIMPIAKHKKVADELKALVNLTVYKRRIHKYLESIRCELDDWLQAEYPTKDVLSDEEFHSMYYGHQFNHLEPLKMIDGNQRLNLLDKIDKIQSIIEVEYHDCKPRKNIMEKLDKVKDAILKDSSVFRVKIVKVKNSIDARP